MTASPPLVDDAAQGTEKLGDAMNLVKDDQAICKRGTLAVLTLS
jgi:hypothetical protein